MYFLLFHDNHIANASPFSGRNILQACKSRSSLLTLASFTSAVSRLCLRYFNLHLTLFSAYERMAFKYYPTSLPYIGNCAGSESAALFGCFLLTSYLFLFINFYFQTYKKPTTKNALANGTANGHSNGKANGTTCVFFLHFFLLRLLTVVIGSSMIDPIRPEANNELDAPHIPLKLYARY